MRCCRFRPDFLKSRLHPRALQELPFRDESSDFGLYTSGGGGRNGALDESDRERNSDALRRQLEECDAAQGTQVRCQSCLFLLPFLGLPCPLLFSFPLSLTSAAGRWL